MDVKSPLAALLIVWASISSQCLLSISMKNKNENQLLIARFLKRKQIFSNSMTFSFYILSHCNLTYLLTHYFETVLYKNHQKPPNFHEALFQTQTISLHQQQLLSVEMVLGSFLNLGFSEVQCLWRKHLSTKFGDKCGI